MTEKVSVSRAAITALVGVAADVDDQTLNNAIEKMIADHRTRQHAQRNRELEPADKRLVAAALAQGKITKASEAQWLKALQDDRDGTQKILANLAPGLLPNGRVAGGADADLERVHDRVMAALGIKPPPEPTSAPQRVAAAAPQAPPPPSGTPVDMLGLPVSVMPDPVRIFRGKPPEQWTQQEVGDYFLRQLGPRFYPGTNPPPAGDVWYQPSPNDHSEYVETADGQGYWQDKNDYLGRI